MTNYGFKNRSPLSNNKNGTRESDQAELRNVGIFIFRLDQVRFKNL